MFLKKKSSQLLKKVGSKPNATPRRAEHFENDVVYENERGTVLFKISRFSRRSLLPTDLPPYCDAKYNPVVDMKYYICPPGWEWISEWIIDMKDTDDEGWSYNSSFSKTEGWTSLMPPNQVSAVRRRKWIRMRKVVTSSANGTTEQLTKAESIYKSIQQKRNDREKLVALKEFSDDSAPISIDFLIALLGHFDFQSSKLKASLIIAPLVQDSETAKLVVNSLEFFGDKLAFLKTTKIPNSMFKGIMQD